MLEGECELVIEGVSKMTEMGARKYLEKLRWPDGAVCPRCGGCDPYKLKAKAGSRKPVREGVYKCRECRKQFTVTVGTIFEGSHVPITKWLTAFHLACASKKGKVTGQMQDESAPDSLCHGSSRI